jgi:hypothetical protein
MMRLPQISLACGGLLLAVAGCGGTYDSSVAGIVTLDGNIVPRGTVTFSPQGSGPPAFGLISSEGKYNLRTGREDGLPPGQYTVTVAANEPPAVSHGKDGGPPPVGKAITPDWYRDPNFSGLSFTVKSGKNQNNLELKKTPPAGWKPTNKRR